MPLTDYFILAFASTQHAIRVEDMMKKAGLPVEMIPTPRDITASCGLSIKLHMNNYDRVREVVDISQPGIKLYRGLHLNKKTIYLEEE